MEKKMSASEYVYTLGASVLAGGLLIAVIMFVIAFLSDYGWVYSLYIALSSVLSALALFAWSRAVKVNEDIRDLLQKISEK